MYVSDAKNTGYTTVSNNTRRKHVEEDITLSAEVKSSEQSGVSTYDFTHMTRGKMLETVNQLIKSGQMSLDETSSLVLLMGPKMTASGNFVDASNEPVDFIASLKNSLTYNQSIGNNSAIFYDTKALDALERLQGKSSKIDLTA